MEFLVGDHAIHPVACVWHSCGRISNNDRVLTVRILRDRIPVFHLCDAVHELADAADLNSSNWYSHRSVRDTRF